MKIHRLSLPPPDRPVRGWCLYLNDRWDGECPQEQDELGFVVYADEDSAYAALARELRSRHEAFEAGELHGALLQCQWYPMPVLWFADGHMVDGTNSEQWPF